MADKKSQIQPTVKPKSVTAKPATTTKPAAKSGAAEKPKAAKPATTTKPAAKSDAAEKPKAAKPVTTTKHYANIAEV